MPNLSHWLQLTEGLYVLMKQLNCQQPTFSEAFRILQSWDVCF